MLILASFGNISQTWWVGKGKKKHVLLLLINSLSEHCALSDGLYWYSLLDGRVVVQTFMSLEVIRKQSSLLSTSA